MPYRAPVDEFRFLLDHHCSFFFRCFFFKCLNYWLSFLPFWIFFIT